MGIFHGIMDIYPPDPARQLGERGGLCLGTSLTKLHEKQ